MEADAAEIDRQLLFQRSDDDLKDALDILPLADCPGNLVKQIEARELRLYLRLRAFTVRDVVE
jgi:hypothetical protein